MLISYYADKVPYYWPMDEIDLVDNNVVGSSIITPSPNPSPPQAGYLLGLDSGNYLNSLRVRGTEAYANFG